MGVSRLHKLVLLPDSRAAPPARQGFQVLVEVDVACFHGFEGMFVSVAMLDAQKLQLDGWMYDVYFKVWIVDNKSLDPKKIGIPKNKILAAR